MEERDFYVTLQSDSCPNFFINTITDFRNQFSTPIKLDGRYEVALVECSYVHSSVIIERGEKICTYNDKVFSANKNYLDLKEVFEDLKVPGLKIENGMILFTQDESEKPSNILEELKRTNQIVKERSYDRGVFSLERVKRPKIERHKNILGIKWEPKISSILGYNAETEEYEHEIFEKAGMTEMFVYCDIVSLQRVGAELVPLLKKMSYEGENGKITMREFVHNQYKEVVKSEIDSIRTYIRSENGLPVPLQYGNFSATLHFRPV
jgi:hypothetical protein